MIPTIKNGEIKIKGNCYYLEYDVEDTQGEMYLCKVNDTNTRYVKDMAEWSINDLKKEFQQQKEFAEVEAWTIDSVNASKL